MERTFRARFLDGVEPRGIEGSVYFDEENLVFSSTGAPNRSYAYRNVRNAHRLGNEYHIELKAPEGGGPPHKIITGTAAEEILQLAVLHRGAGGGQSLLFRLKRIPAWGWLMVAAVLLPSFYLLTTRGAPMAHVFFPVSFEEKLGESIYRQLAEDEEVCDDPALRGWLQEVVDTLVPEGSPYTYTVSIFSSETANAFALPGGRIVVYSGLLELSDEPGGIAGVLAHEIAHIEYRHGLKQLLRVLGLFYFMSNAVGGGIEEMEALEAAVEISSLFVAMKYSRAAEREADAAGIRYLHQNQRSVAGLRDLFTRLSEEMGTEAIEKALRWVSSHPMTAERVAVLSEALNRETFAASEWHEAATLWKDFQESCLPDTEEEAGAD